VIVLEFGQPHGAFGALFRTYSKRVMPLIGGALTGNRAAYEYLPRTAGAFPAGERFLALMAQSRAFSRSDARPLTFGTAYVYRGVK
jgi:demethylmenaquinone methyltransferase/2-methoxy-6-polyprenyl-1,4-benzoquinol methylase